MPKKAKHSHRQAQHHSAKEKRKGHAPATEDATDDHHPVLSSQTSTHPPPPSYFVKGLSNHGNCCFFNAMMQMLASSALLSSASVTKELQQLGEYGPCISSALAGINTLGGKGQPFSVRPLLKLLAKKYSFMDGYTQQDSHEALMLLLDMLDEEIAASITEKGGKTDSKNSLQRLLEAEFVSTVTCGTCAASSDSQQSSWIMTLPIQTAVLDAVASDSAHHYGVKDKAKDKAAGAKDKTPKVSAKERKARLKAEKRAERQKRKGRGPHHDVAADEEVSDEDEPGPCGDDKAEAVREDEAAPSGDFPELTKDASRVLVQSMDLKQSMRERHGWSAPWLPGLWLMPDGSVFHPAQSSLLVSLQMYFEREQGIMWKCPRALETIKSEQQRRQERKALRVRIAERARRERVFEVPGRSQSTTRAIPSADMWRAFTDGSQTWEKSWTCPYDPDTRVVIQVATISEHSWFENQHPSSIADYNDPSSSSTLTKLCDRLEVTLNKDLGAQYVETHQLAIPPVPCISHEDLQLLTSVTMRHNSMSCDEYHTCVKTIEDVICKAQVLLECAHDALTDVGVEGIGKLFGAPISLIHDEQEEWLYRVQGRYVSEGTDLSVDTADIRKHFMQGNAHSEEAWTYPAPQGYDSSDSPEPEAAAPEVRVAAPEVEAAAADQSRPAPLVVSVETSGEAVADCEAEERAEGSTAEVLSSQEAQTPTRERAQGMRRTDSWTEDKFTAKPGRTQFPALSVQNHMLEEMDASSVDEEVEPDTAESSDEGPPGTPESPCPPLFPMSEAKSAEAGSPEPIAEGARPSKKLAQATAPWSTCAGGPSSTKPTVDKCDKTLSSHAPPDGQDATCNSVPATTACSPRAIPPGESCVSSEGLVTDVKASANGSEQNGSSAQGEAVSERRVPSSDLARSLSELKLSAKDVELHTSAPCSSLQPQCKIHPDRSGILLYPDDGTRPSERNVMLQKLPPLLLCHFNRFQHSVVGTRKVTVHVSFPFHLYVHPNVARKPADSFPDDSCAVRYRLKAVLEHHGRQASSGHYTSYVWRPKAVVAAATQHAQQQRAGPSANSKSMKGKAHPRDIERPKRQSKGGGHTARSLTDTASTSEFHSTRRSIDSSMASSFTEASENTFTPGSSFRQPIPSLGSMQGSIPTSRPLPGLSQVACEETASVEADLSVADWEELADIPAGLSCNTERISMPSVDVQDAVVGDCESGGLGSGVAGDTEGSPCAEENTKEEPVLQNLMAENDGDDSGVWLKCDDERVYEVPWQTVSSAQAYMLMYEQTQCRVNQDTGDAVPE